VSTNNLFISLLTCSLVFIGCSKSTELLFIEGRHLQNEKEYAKAITIYNQLIKRNGKLQKAFLERGICYLYLKKYEQAIENFNIIISLRKIGNFEFSLNEDSPFAPEEAHYQTPSFQAIKNRGIAYFFLDSLDKASLDMGTAIKNNFELSNSMIWQGNISYKMGDTENACKLFNNAKELNDTAANEFIQKYCTQ